MLEKKEFFKVVNQILADYKFTKSKPSIWQRVVHDNLVQLIELQKSRYDNSYYVNVHIENLKKQPLIFHLRWNSLAKSFNDGDIELTNLNQFNEKNTDQKIERIKLLFSEVVNNLDIHLSSFKQIQELLKKEHFFIIPLLKYYEEFNLPAPPKPKNPHEGEITEVFLDF